MSTLREVASLTSPVFVSVGLAMITSDLSDLDPPMLRVVVRIAGIVLILLALLLPLAILILNGVNGHQQNPRINLENSPRVKIKGNASTHDIDVKDSPDAEIDLREKEEETKDA